MKIAYNSAYVQLGTFNCTFAPQAIKRMAVIVSTSKKMLCLILRYKPIICRQWCRIVH